MKFTVILFLAFSSLFLKAQNKWSFLTSVEESMLIGDQSSLLTLTNLNSLFSNFGIRTGVHRVFSDQYAADVSFGITGIAKTNTYTATILPVQVTLRYNLLSSLERFNSQGTKLNVNVGAGGALYRTTGVNFIEPAEVGFSFSENFSLGSSIEFNLSKSGALSLGYRHSLYLDDNLDTDPSGLLGDVLGSFYTAVRWNIKGNSTKTRKVSKKMSSVDSNALEAELKIAQAKVKAMEKAVLQMKSMKPDPIKIDDNISDMPSDTTLTSIEKATDIPMVKTSDTKRYAIIIASYKSEAVAQSLAQELGNTAQVIAVPELGRFRVAYDVYDTYQDAKKFQEELVLDFGNCWIVNL